MKRKSLEEEIIEKDKKQLNKMKQQEEIQKATLNSFKEDLIKYLNVVLENLHKFYIVNIMYKTDENKLYDFFEYEDFTIYLIGKKNDILKHLLKKSDKYDDYSIIPKREVFSFLDNNYEKIVKTTCKDFKSYFDFELKEEIIKEFIQSKNDLIDVPNTIAYKNQFGDAIRKYVDYEQNLVVNDTKIDIIDIPHFVPPIEEVKKVEIQNKKEEIDKKFLYVIGLIFGISIAIFNLIISPILFFITAIILVLLGVIVKTKQPKGFGKK